MKKTGEELAAELRLVAEEVREASREFGLAAKEFGEAVGRLQKGGRE
jgi:hypothetical protein